MIKLIFFVLLLWIVVSAARDAEQPPTVPTTVPATILDHAGR